MPAEEQVTGSINQMRDEGRKITYIASALGITQSHLSSCLHGKREFGSASKILAVLLNENPALVRRAHDLGQVFKKSRG